MASANSTVHTKKRDRSDLVHSKPNKDKAGWVVSRKLTKWRDRKDPHIAFLDGWTKNREGGREIVRVTTYKHM